MCRLIGYVAAHPSTLAELIGPQQCDSFRALAKLHADGWGSAWVAGRHPDETIQRVRDTVLTPDYAPIVQATDQSTARARILHLRLASPGIPIAIANNQPFIADGIAFAHNGGVFPVSALRPLISPAVLRSVEGDTDSELYFALIRQNIGLGNPIVEAVRLAVAQLRQHFPTASLNALLLTKDELIAVHASENLPTPLAELQARGLSVEQLPKDHTDNYYRLSYLRTVDGGTVIASSGIDTEGWIPLPPLSIASISLSTLELTITRLQKISEGMLR